MNIPILDLQSQYRGMRADIDEAMARVMASGRFILGPEVRAFEQEMCAYLGVPHAIGCASGTDALQVALMAAGLRPGDEVITTPFTFVATAEAIALLGGVPVFVDIDPRTFLIDPARIEERITPRTRAIIPVHLYGQACDMDAILQIARPRGIAVIEDSAQSIGAKHRDRMTCALGDYSCVSFYPTKNLGAYGDGGMITALDDDLAGRVRRICNHGQFSSYEYDRVGVNSRLDELQAAILRVKLQRLDAWNSARRRIAAMYTDAFAGSPVVPPAIGSGGDHIYHQYTVRVPSRDEVARGLAARGVGHGVYYPLPLHLQPAYAGLGGKPGDFPNAEAASREVLSLPIYPELTDDRVRAVADAVLESLTIAAAHT